MPLSMTGAALLAGRAALRAGAGRVYLHLLDPAAPRLDPGSPELMLADPITALGDAFGGLAIQAAAALDVVSAFETKAAGGLGVSSKSLEKVSAAVIVGAAGFVTVKSPAVAVVASSVSLAVRVKLIDALFVGSTWPAACASVSVGATESKVTERLVPPTVVVALPGTSLTENVPLGATVTAPWPVAVTVTVKAVPEPVTEATVPLVAVKSPAVTVEASRPSFDVNAKAIDEVFVGSAWPAAFSRVTVGAVMSYVTARS